MAIANHVPHVPPHRPPQFCDPAVFVLGEAWMWPCGESGHSHVPPRLVCCEAFPDNALRRVRGVERRFAFLRALVHLIVAWICGVQGPSPTRGLGRTPAHK